MDARGAFIGRIPRTRWLHDGSARPGAAFYVGARPDDAAGGVGVDVARGSDSRPPSDTAYPRLRKQCVLRAVGLVWSSASS